MKMNVKNLIAAVTLLTSAGAVLAGDVSEFVDHTGFVSTKTRAQVIAEMQPAAAQGSLSRVPEYVDHGNVVSSRSRAEVIAEMQLAAAQGSLGRVPEYVDHSNVVSTRTREEVRNEAIQAAKSRRTNSDVGG